MPVRVRLVEDRDIAAMAAIRAQEWETADFWDARIRLYLSGEHSPQQALPTRAGFVAGDSGAVVGFTAGHLTRRYGCDGELQWMNVTGERRGHGIAGMLLVTMAAWFVQHNAWRICVNVAPGNLPAIRLYEKSGAQSLNDYWMVWEDIRKILNHDFAPEQRSK